MLREAESIELQLKADELTPERPASDRPPAPNPWMEVSAYPVRVGEGTGSGDVGTIVVMRDVTAARDARAVRDAFIGILSHELRTPVTTIYGGSEVLARSGSDAGRVCPPRGL